MSYTVHDSDWTFCETDERGVVVDQQHVIMSPVDKVKTGVVSSDILNYMLHNSCNNPCRDPENDGYNQYDFETHCVAFRFIAKPVGGHQYHVKAIYQIDV